MSQTQSQFKSNVGEVQVGDIVIFEYNGGTRSDKRVLWVTEVDDTYLAGFDLSLVEDVGDATSTFRRFFKNKVRSQSLKFGAIETYMCGIELGTKLENGLTELPMFRYQILPVDSKVYVSSPFSLFVFVQHPSRFLKCVVKDGMVSFRKSDAIEVLCESP